MDDSKEPAVSRKLKAIVYILTAITLFAFIAFFTKLINKQTSPLKLEKQIKDPRTLELEKTGERLQQVGLIEQALDQYIEIWTLQKLDANARAQAAYTAGKLYLKLGNCKEALVWLFRSEAASPEKADKLKPLIDTCVSQKK